MSSSSVFECLSGFSAEEQTTLSQFGQGPIIQTSHALVHEAFESTVESQPDIIAAYYDQTHTLTYRELDDAANRLSNALMNAGLLPRQRVCLVVQRSLEMLVGIMAILKAGCQYVPIDGGVASDKQLKHILSDTEAHHVLCLPKFCDRTRQFAGADVCITPLNMELYSRFSKERPETSVTTTDGCYAIYTSGSTGTPKGVDVSHKNVTNALLLEPANLGIQKGSKVGSVLSVAFDMGAWEILACLMNGGTLYMRGSDWKATLEEIDTLVSTPTILSKYRRHEYPNIKTIVTGGEPCPQSLADEWAEGNCFYNICGPTEITILNSAHRHVPGALLTIGKPLPNTTCYVLDEDENPVPIGTKGSAWVGGSGVTRGYINLPELTSSRYKLDKFRNDGSMMFNTNDIVCWNTEGSLEMFGRNDDQVKIKGFRIELDGVSAIIENYNGVVRAAAMKIGEELHAFYCTSGLVNEETLIAAVKEALPYYSVPTKWHFVASIPLTANGKVDKNNLREFALCPRESDSGVDLRLDFARLSPFATDLKYQPSLASLASPGSESNFPQSPAFDTEKGIPLVETVEMKLEALPKVPQELPAKKGFHGQRWVRHRGLILYRKFFSVILIINLIVAVFLLHRSISLKKRILADLATAAASNICVAVLMRSEPVVNLLFTVFCSVPTFLPLTIRRQCAKIFHIGGIHSACAIAATMWFVIFTIAANIELVSQSSGTGSITTAPVVLSYLAITLLIAIGALSHPEIRSKYHDLWEASHRFGGWTALIIIWVQTFLATKDLNAGIAPSKAYLNSPPVWLISIATAAIIFPWVHLRKVNVRSEVLSTHAVRLWFDYTTPTVGTAVRLANRPLADWHGFATITNPPTIDGGKGFSLIVSRAGDFTGAMIANPQSRVWVRGIPACGVLRIATLFRSVVLVATGSGIGPCLAVILAKKVPARILWTAPNPEETFGKDIVNSVLDTDPHAVIHNTRTMGKPNMSLMAYQMWKESGAEAVCIISNKKFTQKLVYDMEARGIPAYGAIFDS